MEMGVSVKTIERIRANAGVTKKDFARVALNLISRLGESEAALRLRLPEDALIDMPERYQAYIRFNPHLFDDPESLFRKYSWE